MEDLGEADRAAGPAAVDLVVDLAAADLAMIVLPTPAMAADLDGAAPAEDLDAAGQATMVLPALAQAGDLGKAVPAAARAGRTAARGRPMRLARLSTIPLPAVRREAVSPA